ncbi:MAG: hypothetical protein H6737_17035 [Alphaproteobacteria bacterium]|nr:hypothetical protein [Alphaproteobacteria bacterium]
MRPFNNEGDTISIEVAPGDLGDPLTVDLTSNTGAVVIGSATVDPGRGPVGTNHLLIVEVFDDWQERIELATITSDGQRGSEEYTMRQDAADPGFFDLTLTSLGLADETRTDTWTITLWEPSDAPEVVFEDEATQ